MKTLEVSVEGINSKYEIIIGKDSLAELYKYISVKYKGKKAVVITDDNVDKLHGASLHQGVAAAGANCRTIAVSPGEKSKSLQVLAGLYEQLAGFNINRGDLVIALGGGVVGDLAGFASATYLRGVAYVQIPTTLLAQVDSSVGGKTAIDLPNGKNLVGAFYQPEKVFIDTSYLNTLEDRYLRDGMAEVIKYGCIKDIEFFKRLSGFDNINECMKHMDELVYTCCSIKGHIVELDERDTGERMLLNFGHTLGHAVEQYFNYEKYTHGEAVAMGMAEVTRRSEEAGLTESGATAAIEKILGKYGLPSKLPVADSSGLISAMRLDKKISGDSISLVLLSKVGEAFIRKMSCEELAGFMGREARRLRK